MELDIAVVEMTTGLVGDILDGLSVEDLTLPTPCTDWDVRALIGHLTAGDAMAAARLTGSPLPDPESDFAGNDPVGAWHSAAREALAAFGRDGVLEEKFPHRIFGEISGRELLRLRIFDTLAHAWDLAVATGRPRDREPELYEQALEWATPMVANRPPAAEANFASPQPAPEDACAADKYAALLGRTVPIQTGE